MIVAVIAPRPGSTSSYVCYIAVAAPRWRDNDVDDDVNSLNCWIFVKL